MRTSVTMRSSTVAVLLAVVVLPMLGCPQAPRGADGATATDTSATCSKRTGGAEIAIKVNDQTFRFWSVNAAFIDKAIAFRDTKKPATIMFKHIIDGADCDVQWTFHVDPAEMDWPHFTTEVCDGRPSDIEGDKKHWINDVKRWCPWSALVTEVTDRRAK